jgi:hypothetical protein
VNTQITESPNDPKRPHAGGTTDAPGLRMTRVARPWLAGLLALTIAAGGTFVVWEIVSPAVVPVALRGKWVVVDGKGLQGATLEFHRNGDLLMTVIGPGKKEIQMSSAVQFDGNRFRITAPGGVTGAETTENHDILELTGELFVTQDSKGEVLILERIPPRAPTGTTGSGKWPRRNVATK